MLNLDKKWEGKGRVSIAITIEFYVTVFALRSWLIIEMSIKMLIGKEREREIDLCEKV